MTCVHPGSVVMILRKPVGNPDDFFLRDFSDYKEGFSARGKNIKAHDMKLQTFFRREMAWAREPSQVDQRTIIFAEGHND